MISPYKVTWNGINSLDLDLWAELSFDGDSGATESYLNRESVTTEHFDGTHRRIHNYKWNDVLTPTITFIKQSYEDFTQEENRRILAWLTSSNTANWLDVYHDDTEVISYRLYGNWIEIEQYKLANGRVVGYVCSFESSSPFAWSRKFEVTKQISEPTTFTLACNSDEYNKLIFPKVTITFCDKNIYIPVNEDPTADLYEMMPNTIYLYNDHYYVNINGNKYTLSGIFSADINDQVADYSTLNKYYYFPNNKAIYKGVVVENTSYGWELATIVGAGVQIENSYKLNGEIKISKTTVVGGVPEETIVLDGMNKVVTSSLTPMRIIGNDFNWEWTPIAFGENTFTVTGNCTVKFEWIEPLKVGSM